jgi:hypothetical protein
VPGGLALAELSRVRARFIADCGWAEYEDVLAEFEARDRALAAFGGHEEVVLWFEHDLYDQLQLAQVLDWFATQDRGRTKITHVFAAEYLGPLALERVRELAGARREVSDAQLALGRDAWRAFRSPDPCDVEAIVALGTAELPYLGPALRRHLEQYPWVGSGLSRVESQALAAIAAGRRTVRTAYAAAHHESEDPVWLGDTVFAWYVERLATGRAPVLELGEPTDEPMDREVFLTKSGRDVLEGRADRVALNGVDCWLGGVRLFGDEAAWRWDPSAECLVSSL